MIPFFIQFLWSFNIITTLKSKYVVTLGKYEFGVTLYDYYRKPRMYRYKHNKGGWTWNFLSFIIMKPNYLKSDGNK